MASSPVNGAVRDLLSNFKSLVEEMFFVDKFKKTWYIKKSLHSDHIVEIFTTIMDQLKYLEQIGKLDSSNGQVSSNVESISFIKISFQDLGKEIFDDKATAIKNKINPTQIAQIFRIILPQLMQLKEITTEASSSPVSVAGRSQSPTTLSESSLPGLSGVGRFTKQEYISGLVEQNAELAKEVNVLRMTVSEKERELEDLREEVSRLEKELEGSKEEHHKLNSREDSSESKEELRSLSFINVLEE
ncbi:hypothetical protein LCGC14_2294820 [marine sediment metagenome]|uniref:Uncharacterized protein n=1 Tax=marine sediment metagenome TaxID=412755 RepID=A0A0F9DCS1_9ZZZZ|nr:hypothetical protein [Chlamydiota bacterium]